MPLLKKIDPSWQPSENKGLQVGEIMEFNGAYEELVKGEMAMLVDEAGNEQELPNQRFTCPICFTTVTGLLSFVDHISEHSPRRKEVKEAAASAIAGEITQEITTEPVVDTRAEEIKAKRRAALEKARAARKLKLAQ